MPSPPLVANLESAGLDTGHNGHYQRGCSIELPVPTEVLPGPGSTWFSSAWSICRDERLCSLRPVWRGRLTLFVGLGTTRSFSSTGKIPMSAIWIVLLDTSSSMDEGFSAQSGAGGNILSETGEWAKKIDAAKEILRRQVSSLRDQDIAVIQFTDEARKLFQGTRDGLLKNTGLIASLEANGGTSIAAALDSVTSDPDFESYRALSVLLLTDGQSDIGEATRAANHLIAKFPFARIDSIIIDETDEGRAVVEAASINGTVRNATSAIQLSSAFSGARVSGLRGELQNMAFARFTAQEELARLQEGPGPTLIRVTTGEVLTAATLRDDIAPTLLALESIDAAGSIARRREPRATVSSISQDSPISINLTGIRDAVQLVLEYAIPWRRKHAERLSELEIRKRECEIDKIELENSLYGFEHEKRRLDLAKLQYEVALSKWEIAERMMKEIDPDNQLRGEAREEAVRRVLIGIDQLASTRLEFEVVRERQSN